jgi:uncharacterized protein (TIGR02284 family)
MDFMELILEHESDFLLVPSRMPANAEHGPASKVRRKFIMDNKEIRSSLEDLIETCKDGHKGYQDAASHVKRTDLKTYFNERSLERARFAEELRQELTRLGEPDKKPSGTAGGAMRRAWIDTKVALGGGDKTILNSLEAGEDTAKDQYQKALAKPLPSNIADIVRQQALSVQKTHDHVRMLRDTAAAA